jgi:hypothetical protein
MSRNVITRFRAVSVLGCVVLCAVTAFGQGTAFTYQGQLNNAGAPANGQYDFQFALYDGLMGGTQQGGTLTFDGAGGNPGPVTLTDGLFTVQLDFGNQFPGAPRFLQIGVRPHATGSYALLSPSQPLTPTPYSVTAEALVLPFSEAVSSVGNAFEIINTNFGNGIHASGENGVLGESLNIEGTGVLGICNYGPAAYGVWGQSSTGYGVVASNTTSGNTAYLGTANEGVYGSSGGQFVPSRGVYGGNTYYGLYGELGTTGEGVYGWGGAGSIGVNGQTTGGTGVNGAGYNGVWGTSYSNGGNGVRGDCNVGASAYGVWGLSSTGWAGTFSGNAQVTGSFFGGAKFFRIDHPLEPENKYLIHSCVESNEMKNVYDGVIALDANGEAWVQLPAWFESLNTAFRYQLTCIGQPALVYIKQKISGNSFQIAGGQPSMEVSWQVTGVRQDAYAKANPMQVEVAKQGAEQGRYLHPAAFGQPETMSVEYERIHAVQPVAARP